MCLCACEVYPGAILKHANIIIDLWVVSPDTLAVGMLTPSLVHVSTPRFLLTIVIHRVGGLVSTMTRTFCLEKTTTLSKISPMILRLARSAFTIPGSSHSSLSHVTRQLHHATSRP